MKQKRASRADLEAVSAFIPYAAQTIGLDPHWRILVFRDSKRVDDGHGERTAAIDPVYGRHVADMYLGWGWGALSERDQLEVIFHELLHLTHRNVTDVVRLNLFDAIAAPDEEGDARVPFGPPLYWALESAHRSALEQMVDLLARAFAAQTPARKRWAKCKAAAGA